MSTYTDTHLRNIFQSPFNPDEWQDFLQNFFGATELRHTPERLDTPDIGQGYYLGCIDTSDSYRIGLFRYEISKGSVANKRVELRNLVKSFINPRLGEFDAVLAVFDSGDHWRLSFICDIKGEATAPKRYTYVFGNNHNLYRTPIERFAKLKSNGITFANLKEAFSVEALSKDFYNKLYLWYQWALSPETGVTFPNNPETEKDDRENLHVKLIRLITRMLFVWFIKQKHLVPDNIFDARALKNILVDFDEKSFENGNYYNAILQNLFFATLNCAIVDEDGNQRRFANASARDTRNLYRYAEMFNMNEQEVIHMFSHIPFLNGGLFDCLDKPKGLYIDLEHDILYDGFSRNAAQSANGNYKYRAFIPNVLFFNDDEQQPGLITLFNQYNFTIEENSPTDAEISLDPELLGRVFENLLAAYNPETQESARKSTGSFYTPREIVDYMVDESLKTYLLGAEISGLNENMLDTLLHTHILSPEWNREIIDEVTDALKRVKILDPACGSGAFPMGCMLRMVEIIELLHNNSINRYRLKLDIIENCVFGVDIQPIAMLICKLRFFISLVCEQKDIDFNDPAHNYGINTLPNLETKFVAANTLLSADIRKFDQDWTADDDLRTLQEQLLTIRNHHLLAKGRKAKRQCQREDKAKRAEILQYIIDHAQKPDEQRIAEWEEQIKTLKTRLEQYKEEVWVDETLPIENTLFGPVQTPQALFRKDMNEPKRNELLNSIHNIEDNIKKEKRKAEINGFEAAVKQITEWDPYNQNSVSPFFDPEWMFCLKEKFDIVIGNPPYISTKGISEKDKKRYEQEFGFSDDTYNLFTFKGLFLCKSNGSLTYITPKTYWTTQTKRNMRELLLSNKINYIFDTANPFEAAMVDTCIIQVSKTLMPQTHCVKFLDGTNDLTHPIVLPLVPQNVFLNTLNCVIFKPTQLNMRIYELYGEKVKELYEKWWDKIKTSRDIAKHQEELEAYRNSLKPGDIALLGCLTEGGQGLATANNGKYIAVRRSTKWAKNIIDSRPKKLAEAIKKKKIEIEGLNAFPTTKEFLQSLSEKEIANLFDSLKEQYGRDIFGQGYIYKIIDDSEMANVDELTQDEKENGIDTSKNYYVPYDKGDKDGNRWYLETPFAIAWSKENVQFLKTDPKARYQGYAFYFREGFCWNNILNPQARLLKVKLKQASVNDVGSMSLMTVETNISNRYIIGLLNSNLIFDYYRVFINCTVNIQINDLRQIPIMIPTIEDLHRLVSLVDKAVKIKKLALLENRANFRLTAILKDIEKEIDMKIIQLYRI